MPCGKSAVCIHQMPLAETADNQFTATLPKLTTELEAPRYALAA